MSGPKRHADCWQAMANATYQRHRAGLAIPALGRDPKLSAHCKQLGPNRWRFTWGDFSWEGEACCQHRARERGLNALTQAPSHGPMVQHSPDSPPSEEKLK